MEKRRASYHSDHSQNRQALNCIDEIIEDIRKLPTSLGNGRRRSESDRTQLKTLNTVKELSPELCKKKKKAKENSKSEKTVSEVQKQKLRSHRKSIYMTYISAYDASKRIRQNKLFSGTLKVSSSDSSDAYVICEVLDKPVYIYGSKHRNRALDGDEVAVQLVPVEDMLDEKNVKLQARVIRRASLAHSLQPLPKEEICEKPEYCGRIVCILERPRHMYFSGTLSLRRPLTATIEKKTGSPKIVWVIPTNKRLPLVAVPVRYAPENFVKYCEQYKNRIFLGTIQRWPDSSLHPFGTIEKEIGWIGELSVQSNILVANYHIKNTEFSDLSLKTIKSFPDCPTTLERKNRRNLLTEPIEIFTLDETNHNSEIAFSINNLESGMCEVGIHVVDIAHYVRLGTPLDKEARERCFTVFLAERTLPVLPSLFTESFGNFSPNRERLAISLFCRFSKNGSILHTWIGQTVVKSSAHINPKATSKEVTNAENDAFKLLSLCRKLNQIRKEKKEGIFPVKMSIGFKLGESGYPDALEPFEDNETEFLKAELFRIANIEVGQRIASEFPDQTLLYREPPLKPPFLPYLQDYFKETCHTVQDLIELIEKEPDREKKQALRNILSQELPQPKFCSSGSVDISKYAFHSLDAPIYALFTTPLESYASIVVQRQLIMTLQEENKKQQQCDSVEKVARQCNLALRSKYFLEKENRTLYIAAFIYRQSLENVEARKVQSKAIVIGFDKNALVLYFSEFDLELLVICNQDTMPGHVLNHGVYDPNRKEMNLKWHNTEKLLVQTVGFLSVVSTYLHVNMQTVYPSFIVEIVRERSL